MAMFAGQYENKLDGKGRVSIPAQFRTEVLDSQPLSPDANGQLFVPQSAVRSSGAGDERHIFIYCSPRHENVLEGCDRAYLENISRAMARLEPASKEHEDLVDIYFARTTRLLIDENGRAMLGKALCDYANISKTCLFVGRNDVFEIWNPDKYNQRSFQPVDKERFKNAHAALMQLKFPAQAISGSNAGEGM